MRTKFLVLALLLSPGVASGQTFDSASCNAVTGPFQVEGNGAWSYTFTMQQLVPASETDPTLVTHIYNGFIMQIDTLAEMDMGLGELLGICPNGTQRAGDKVYKIMVQGVKLTKGPHSLALWAWNLDSNGNKRGGVIVRTPFDATEPIVAFDRAPYGPWNVRIYKGTSAPPLPPSSLKLIVPPKPPKEPEK
jgi:hypothetical protein